MRFYILAIVIASLSWGCGGENKNEGDRLFREGQYAKAIVAFNEKLDTNPSDITLLYNRGRAYEELGKNAEAEADFLRIIELDAKNLNVYLSLSQLNYKKGTFNKALIFAEKALELNDNSAEAHFLAARAKHQLGYMDKALESYSLAININKDYGEAYFYRAAIKIGKNQSKSACSDIAKAVNLGVPEASKAQSKYCK